MPKAIITLDDGMREPHIDVSVEFDPPLPKSGPDNAPLVQRAAIGAVGWLASVGAERRD